MGFLDGKAVLITGAGRGLGAAYARLAAHHGGSVVVNDVDLELAEEVAGEIGGVADGSDIATWAGAGQAVARCVEEFGAIDVLVNNAGIFRLAHPKDQDPDEFRSVIEVNVLGTAYCGLHAIRAMLPRGRGSVVNVTSGAHAGSAGMGAYGASKGAVASLTYSWTLDLADTDIRVNAVSPNAHTRMADAYEEFLGEKARGQNVGKTAERNAPAVVYLLSDAASAVRGQVVRIDGDELSIVTHPAVLGTGLRNPEWTVERVAAAFGTELAGRLQPSGLRRT